MEVFSKVVFGLTITKSYTHDITQLLKVLRRGRVLVYGKTLRTPHMVLGARRITMRD